MEYLITFGNKKIALSRADIYNLYPELEGYFIAISQGLNEVETLQFASEYKNFVKNLAEKRKEPLTTSEEEPIIKEVTESTKEEETQEKSAEVYDFNTRRKIS